MGHHCPGCQPTSSPCCPQACGHRMSSQILSAPACPVYSEVSCQCGWREFGEACGAAEKAITAYRCLSRLIPTPILTSFGVGTTSDGDIVQGKIKSRFWGEQDVSRHSGLCGFWTDFISSEPVSLFTIWAITKSIKTFTCAC